MENRSLVSVATTTVTNIDKYMTLVKTLDPELYAIKMALLDSRVNPIVIPAIIRYIANISYGTGFGQIKISISARKIAQVAGTESELVDESAVLYD